MRRLFVTWVCVLPLIAAGCDAYRSTRFTVSFPAPIDSAHVIRADAAADAVNAIVRGVAEDMGLTPYPKRILEPDAMVCFGLPEGTQGLQLFTVWKQGELLVVLDNFPATHPGLPESKRSKEIRRLYERARQALSDRLADKFGTRVRAVDVP